jgi:hypothetical protein
MWGMASQLSDVTIEAISTYYAAQAAPPAKTGDPKLVARGKQIFERGASLRRAFRAARPATARRRAATIFCRGSQASMPTILMKQMLVNQSALRAVPVMHGVI